MWVKKRHKYWFSFLKILVKPILYFKFNYRHEKCKEKGPLLIIGNHSVSYDPFFYAAMFKDNIYYVSSDEIYKRGLFSKFVKYTLAPIPKAKSTKDSSTVKLVLSVTKLKKNICIFPEGETSFSGKNSEIDESISKLAKKIKYKIIIVNVRGGFQTYPKFADKPRKGKMDGYVRKIITPEELELLSEDELSQIIKDNIKVELYDDVVFKSKNRAQYLESAIYYCDICKSFETMYSEAHELSCRNCNTTYHVDGSLNLIKDNQKFTIEQLMNIQKETINSYTLENINSVNYQDEVKIYNVSTNKKVFITSGLLKLNNSIISLNDFKLELKDIISVANTSNHLLDIYLVDKVYQIVGNKKISNIKYFDIIDHYLKINNKV